MIIIVCLVILISRVVIAVVLIVALVFVLVVLVLIIASFVLLVVTHRIDVLLYMIDLFRCFCLSYARPLNIFLGLFKVCANSSVCTTHKVALFVIKYIAFILRKSRTLSVINDVITLELDFCEILVHLIFSQLLRVPFDEVSLVEVLVFALVMDYI